MSTTVNVNGVIKELQQQRNEALNQNAILAGKIAVLEADLEAARAEIARLNTPAEPEAEAA